MMKLHSIDCDSLSEHSGSCSCSPVDLSAEDGAVYSGAALCMWCEAPYEHEHEGQLFAFHGQTCPLRSKSLRVKL